MTLLSSLTTTELKTFLKVIQDSLLIRRHQELFEWLHNDIQYFLPHDILIAAWGDFSLGLVHVDVISSLPGMRTTEVERQKLLPVLMSWFSQWLMAERAPFVIPFDMHKDEVSPEELSVAYLRSALVQGIKDERGRHDCLYICLGASGETFDGMATRSMELLLPYIDAALRQVAHLPAQYPELPDVEADVTNAAQVLDKAFLVEPIPFGLSQREQEIIHWVCMGKTNSEIGLILDISFFTVKNHMQRIFRKLDVLNRAQAVAKCERLGIKEKVAVNIAA
jgi:transcriptional regulator EpsA